MGTSSLSTACTSGIALAYVFRLMLMIMCVPGSPAQQDNTQQKAVHCVGREACQEFKRGPNMTESLEALKQLGLKFLEVEAKGGKCTTRMFGSGWGEHMLCDLKPGNPCAFYSVGISNDYSFDLGIADEWGCQGISLDPTVTHPSSIHSKVLFMQVGARLLDVESDNSFLAITTLPGLKKWLRHSHVSIVKMDCEGCEYSLARDVLDEDPTFFHNIDQFAVEFHVSTKWIKDHEYSLALGQLYWLLVEAGLELQHVDRGHCFPEDEAPGCPQDMKDVGYPCDQGLCHNLLFARYDPQPVKRRRRMKNRRVQPSK